MINLGLILGVARSGTSWIHTVLSQSDTPMRSIKEPLRIFNNLVGNAPEFGMKDFRTFGDIKAFLDNPDHPFLTAIRSCMNLKLSWGDNENSFLQETMSETKEGYYSIYRKTEDQIGRKFRFLSEKEVNLCKGLDNL